MNHWVKITGIIFFVSEAIFLGTHLPAEGVDGIASLFMLALIGLISCRLIFVKPTDKPRTIAAVLVIIMLILQIIGAMSPVTALKEPATSYGVTAILGSWLCFFLAFVISLLPKRKMIVPTI